MIYKTAILTLATLLAVLCIDPPLMPDSFQIAFDQTYIQNGTHYRVNGQVYYEVGKNRERVDRANGRYNLFCGTVLPNVTTACTQLTTGGKRYVIFPQRKQCCFCCDSQHGCGVLKKNWLQGAKYLGVQRLIDTNFNKWSKDGDIGYNYYWVTIDDNQIPRRLDESGTHITDYLVHTYVNKTFDDSYFQVPTYCADNICPNTSFCGKLRQDGAEHEMNRLVYED